MAFKRTLVDAVNMYDKVLELMTANGWQNISSARTPASGAPLRTSEPGVTPVTEVQATSTTAAALSGFKYDWDILKPVGGGPIIQLMPFAPATEANAPNITPNNDIRRSTVKTMGMRMLKNYVPGELVPAVGEPGDGGYKPEYYKRGVMTPVDPGNPWISVHMYGTDNATPATQALAVTVTNIEVIYDVTPTKAVFIFRYPSILAKKASFFYIGIPESVRGNPDGAHDTIFATTMLQGVTGNKIYSIDYPVGVGDVTVNTYLSNSSQLQLPLKNPSYLKEYWLTPIYYGLDTIGMRGKLDGFYALAANVGLIDKDQIMVGSKLYEVVNLGVTSTNCSFGAEWIAVELEPEEEDI